MSIKYKKIIEEIMGDEAKKNGFTITTHPKLLATKPLAYFEKIDGERSQMFEITEYLIGPKTIFLRCCGNEIHLKYEDEQSFRECINKFQEFMINEGYNLLQYAARRPIFTKKDSEYVFNNYEKMFNESSEMFVGKTVNEGLLLIEEMVIPTFEMKWEEAQNILLNAAGVLVGFMLSRSDSIYIEYGTTDRFYIERVCGIDRKAHEDPCNIVLLSYRNKDTKKWFYRITRKFFNDYELYN